MSNQKLTQWYPKGVNPVRKGVYEIKSKLGFPWYRRWDGRVWFVGSMTPHGAAQQPTITYCRDPWRGLREKAK